MGTNHLIVRLTRLILALLHVVYGAIVAGTVFPFISDDRKKATVRAWSARLIAIFRIRLTVMGTPPNTRTGPSMMVANHVSWLDIFAINSVCPMRFIAKIEIRNWPVIGWLCAQADTIFMVRAKSHELRRVNKVISEALISGDRIAVFPEGETTFGDRIESFHAS